MTVPANRAVTRTTSTSRSAEVVRYRLEPVVRRAAEERLIEQIHQAWGLADLAGLRRSSWSLFDNRDTVLRQRIAALDDSRIVELWDGKPPEELQQRLEEEQMMAIASARAFGHERVHLHVPGVLLRSRR